MKPIPKFEIIETLKDWERTLRDSFMDRIGPTKGQITEPRINREIACIRAAVSLIRKSKFKNRK